MGKRRSIYSTVYWFHSPHCIIFFIKYPPPLIQALFFQSWNSGVDEPWYIYIFFLFWRISPRKSANFVQIKNWKTNLNFIFFPYFKLYFNIFFRSFFLTFKIQINLDKYDAMFIFPDFLKNFQNVERKRYHLRCSLKLKNINLLDFSNRWIDK